MKRGRALCQRERWQKERFGFGSNRTWMMTIQLDALPGICCTLNADCADRFESTTPATFGITPGSPATGIKTAPICAICSIHSDVGGGSKKVNGEPLSVFAASLCSSLFVPLKEEEMGRERTTRTFHGWLTRQIHRQDEVGRFALSAINDQRAPITSSMTAWRKHLASRNAPQATVTALEKAYEEFERKG